TSAQINKKGRLSSAFAANVGIPLFAGACFLYFLRRNSLLKPLLLSSDIEPPRLARRSPYVARQAPTGAFVLSHCHAIRYRPDIKIKMALTTYRFLIHRFHNQL